MAKFQFKPTTNVDGYFSAKLFGAVTDNDVGKPFKLKTGTTDTYEICTDGDAIDAFLKGLEPETADGLKFGVLDNSGRQRCEMEDAANIGGLVECGTIAALGTAETNGLPVVTAKSAVAADLATDASGTLIAASVNALLAEALLPSQGWRIISGNTTDGVIADGDTTVIIERV